VVPSRFNRQYRNAFKQQQHTCAFLFSTLFFIVNALYIPNVFVETACLIHCPRSVPFYIIILDHPSSSCSRGVLFKVPSPVSIPPPPQGDPL